MFQFWEPGECRLRIPQMRRLKKQSSKQANEQQGWLKAQERLYWETGLCVSGVSGDGGHRRFSSFPSSTEYSLAIGKRREGDGMKEPDVGMETMTWLQYKPGKCFKTRALTVMLCTGPQRHRNQRQDSTNRVESHRKLSPRVSNIAKRQPIVKKKMFVNILSDRWLLFRIYGEFKKQQ